jgi:ribosomal protein S13
MEANEITDKDLAKMFIEKIGDISSKKAVRWSLVAKVLGVGSTTAAQLCNRYGIPSSQVVGHNECEQCELIEEQKIFYLI